MAKKIVQDESGGNKFFIEADIPDKTSGFSASNSGENVVKATNAFSDSLDRILNFSKTFIDKIAQLEIKSNSCRTAIWHET